MIKKARSIAQQKYLNHYWITHIVPVVKYAKHLSQTECADIEIVELGALMHDIGKTKFGGKDHQITGISVAEDILTEIGYSESVINIVKGCVQHHRASIEYTGDSKIEKIIRDADAISHFDMVPYLIKVGLEKHDNDFNKALTWVYHKLQRDWNDKMHFPESKRLVGEKYKASMLLLEATLQYFE